MFDFYTSVALFHATLKYDFDIDHVSLLPTAETIGWREQELRPVSRAGKTEESSRELLAWKLSLLP